MISYFTYYRHFIRFPLRSHCTDTADLLKRFGDKERSLQYVPSVYVPLAICSIP